MDKIRISQGVLIDKTGFEVFSICKDRWKCGIKFLRLKFRFRYSIIFSCILECKSRIRKIRIYFSDDV